MFYKVIIKEDGFTTSLYYQNAQQALQTVAENTGENRGQGSAFSITIELCTFQHRCQ